MTNNANDRDVPNATFVCSVFALTGRAGYIAPPFTIQYDEEDTGNRFFIAGGAKRMYVSRVGNTLGQAIHDQAADSHFMADRVVAALLIGGAGIYRATPMGRIFVDTPLDALKWHCQIDTEPFYSEGVRAIHEAFDEAEFGSWFVFICHNTPFRRALNDAVQAINNPVEAFVYIYRGFEWLRDGLSLSWRDIATDLGVTVKDIKALGQIANDETGVRHASKSGAKQRADLLTYGTWIVGLIDAIESARARVDITYIASDSNRIVDKIRVALPTDPYP